MDAATGIREASGNADLVLGAGDFATKGLGAAETLDILGRCRVPVILTHGNHDDPEEVQRICAQAPNLYYLHGEAMTVGGTSLFGIGGEIPSRNSFSWNASETEEQAAKMLTECPQNAVLLTHTPPQGVADLQRNGDHEGSMAIYEATLRLAPKLLLCGHIHHAWGSHGKIGSTDVQNLGPTVNWFEI